MELAFLSKHNPWWKTKEEILSDSKVKLAFEKKQKYFPHLFNRRGIYSVRGPRQVGKTTALKLFIYRALFELGIRPEQVLYLPCDTIVDFREIVDAVEIHKQWLSRFKLKENYVLLDEITFVREWFRAVKYIADQELCTLLVFTGSLATGLKEGVERFPGRDVERVLYMPLKFSEYLGLFAEKELRLKLRELREKSPKKNLSEDFIGNASSLVPFLPELNALLENYLVTGGFLSPSYEFYETGRINEETYIDYVNWILGDLSKLERSELFFRETIHSVIGKYGSLLSFHSIAKETSIGSHKTVSEYLKLAENLLLLSTLYKIDINRKKAVFRKQKKYYFTDPFLFSSFSGYLNGTYHNYVKDKNKSFVLEGVISSHLDMPKWYYKDKKGEIDMILEVNGELIPLEVKWQNRVTENDFKHYSLFKKPFIISKSTFKVGKAVIIPAPIFLALL